MCNDGRTKEGVKEKAVPPNEHPSSKRPSSERPPSEGPPSERPTLRAAIPYAPSLVRPDAAIEHPLIEEVADLPAVASPPDQTEEKGRRQPSDTADLPVETDLPVESVTLSPQQERLVVAALRKAAAIAQRLIEEQEGAGHRTAWDEGDELVGKDLRPVPHLPLRTGEA